MKLAPHRTVPNRGRELKEQVEAMARQALFGRRICDRCGATFASFADKCEAGLDETCPGARAIANAQAEAARQLGIG